MTTNGTEAQDAEEAKTLIITLTGRAPAKIREDSWPIIAMSKDRIYEQMAPHRDWEIYFCVRGHADGRALVSAAYKYNTRYRGDVPVTHEVGRLFDAGTDLAAAVTETAEELIELVDDNDFHGDFSPPHILAAAKECITDLPAQELE